jgi:hypothetical protein
VHASMSMHMTHELAELCWLHVWQSSARSSDCSLTVSGAFSKFPDDVGCVQPTWPFGKGRREGIRGAPFFGVNEPIGLMVACAMGLQHALSMVGGIITPAILVYRVTVPAVRSLLKASNCSPEGPFWSGLPCPQKQGVVLELAKIGTNVSSSVRFTRVEHVGVRGT